MNKVKKALLPALFAATALCAAGAVMSANGVFAHAENTGSMQITLTDGIVVKYYATLDASTQSATATFDSAVDSLDATVEGTRKESCVWEFVYTKVTPQYVDQTFSVTVGDQTLLSDYSVLDYCNDVIKKTDATEQEKTVAKDLIYYGQAAKAYRLGGEVTAEPATAFAGADNMSLSGEYTAENKIKSATVVFDTLPALRFFFDKASEQAIVKVNDADVTAQLQEKDGVYSYTVTGIYATGFDAQYKVELIDGDKTQTLLYSVNDYAARMQTSSDAKMQTLAKALWCYGAGAEALLNEQNKYIVVTAPTYTETGLARNGKGEEATLPVLNDTNYTYVQTKMDGSAYAYSNADGGKATFTHKDTGIVIEKTITPDTITFNWTDFNCVDIHFNTKIPSGMTGAYVDGTYVLTLSKDVSIPNMYNLTSTLPNVKLIGGYGLTFTHSFRDINQFTLDGAKISAASATAKGWIVESGELTITDTLTKPLALNGGTVTVNNGYVGTGYLYVAQGATLNVTQSSGNDSFVIPAGGSVELNGTVNVTKPNSTTGTAFNLQSKTANDVTSYAKMKIGETARITLGASYEYLFGCWSTPRTAYLFLPATAKQSGNNAVKVGENTVLSCTTITAGFNASTTVTYGNYRTLTAPTVAAEGTAVSFDEGETTLPALNTTDYDVSVSGTTMSFTHKQYGAKASLSIANASNLKIGDLTIDYDSATATYTYTVAAGKEVALSGAISATNLVFAGAGTITLNGTVSATNLTLNGGVTLSASSAPANSQGIVTVSGKLNVNEGTTLAVKATGGKGDCVKLNQATTEAYFYGTVSVQGVSGATAISCAGSINTDNGDGTYTPVSWVKIYLRETSRVSVTGASFGLFQFSNNGSGMGIVTVYYPEGATVSGNKVTANGNTLYSVSGNVNAKYEQVPQA